MSRVPFRKNSIDRITSPEELNARIQVASPSVWMLLLGIFFVLIGICTWGIFGRMETVISVGAVTKENQTVCYVKEEDFEKISSGMTVRMGQEEYRIDGIPSSPIRVDEEFSDDICYIGDLSRGEWVYEVKLNEAYYEPESIIQAEIVIESIAPMTFVIN